MKTTNIKKCVAILLFTIIVCINYTVMAQIKVVDNNYAENLSATKSYYDRDVDFEKYFPSVSRGQIYPYSSMHPSIAYELRTNLVGDTIYLCEPLSLEITNCNTSHSFKLKNGKVALKNGKVAVSSSSFTVSNPSTTCGSFVMPSGYYLISGYVFCDDNEDALRSQVGLEPFNGGWTSRALKKAIIEKGERFDYQNLSKYQRLLALKPLNGDTVTTYYLHSFEDLFGGQWSKTLKQLHKISVLKRFYDQVATFIGKEVVMFYYRKDIHGEYFSDINDGLIEDEITGDPVMLKDTKYIVQDVVVKKKIGEYRVFVVMKGEKTGSFARQIGSVKFAFTLDDVDGDIYPNTTRDIPVLQGYYDCYDFIVENSKLNKIKQRTNALKAQREREIKQQEAKEEAALARQMVAKFGAEYGGLIAKKQVSVGMTKEMCKAAWGYPMNTYRTTTKFGQSEVWCYNYKTRVYFFEGKVVQIDE